MFQADLLAKRGGEVVGKAGSMNVVSYEKGRKEVSLALPNADKPLWIKGFGYCQITTSICKYSWKLYTKPYILLLYESLPTASYIRVGSYNSIDYVEV